MSPRAAAVAGVAGIVLTLLGGFAAGTPVPLDSTTEQVRLWLMANAATFTWGVPLLILGWCLLLILGSGVAAALSDRGEQRAARVVLALWVVVTALAILQASTQAMLGSVVVHVDDSALRLLYTAFAISDLNAMLPLGLFVVTATVAGVRCGWLAGWTLIVAVLVGVLCIASVAGFAVYAGPWIAQGPVQSAALLAAYAWVALVAVSLARSEPSIADA